MKTDKHTCTLVLMALLGGCAATPPPKSQSPQTAPVAQAAPPEDPYLWLEDVTGEKALAWARQENARSQAELEAASGFAALQTRLRTILDSKEQIPWVNKMGAYYYNLWQDDAHVRGLWRRTSPAEYKKAQPKWETVLDLDELAAKEKDNWVWHGANCLYPKRERCLIRLSRGGSDADVVREFDTTRKAFVEGGFTLSEAKNRVQWKDLDTLYVGTDFGAGSLTDSGYPRIVKEWKRGTPLAEAKQLFEGQKSDVSAVAARRWDHGRVYDLVERNLAFYKSETWLRDGDKLTKVEVPLDAEIDLWDGQLLVRLRSDWTIGSKTWPRGAFLATSLDAFLKGGRDFFMLFEPTPQKSFAGSASLKTALIINELEDVHNRLYVWTHKGGKWSASPLPVSGLGTFDAWPVEANDSDEYWFMATDFTLPTTLLLGAVGKPQQKLKASPSFFKADGLIISQHFVKSKDGTRVPYFEVAKKGITLDGKNPTLLNGYGGFEISMQPGYDGLTGAGWLERGGVFVMANIRGGGEYGPAWHQAALKQKRQNAYDDFIAIAEDLIARKLTSPAHLGIWGGSNGGLLMGVMLTERPDLFGAIVCQVPLLDMKRYHKLLAGASWMSEYGNPDVPEEWAAISKYSPYQNVKKDVKYPRTFFATSTRDDRVHPGHARKMVARMLELGHNLLYYENIEGGHGGAANHEQRAHLEALAFTFLAKQLGLGVP